MLESFPPSIRARVGLLVLAAVLPTGAVAAIAREALAGQADPTASFDYSVPARFAVPAMAEPQPPSPDATRYFDGPVRPVSWRVDLDACASSGAITSYRWEVDGAPLAVSTFCDDVAFHAPAEGVYEITLTVADGAGAVGSVTRDVRVQDWLLFGLGDSYASGEGVPDEPVTAAQVTAVASAQDLVADADIDVEARLADLASAEDALASLLPLVAAAAAAYDAWGAAVAEAEDACDDFPPNLAACAAAQASAAAAQADLGAALADLDLEDLLGTDDVPAALDDLTGASEQAVADAAAALADARAAADAAAAVLDAALADLGPRWLSRQCHRSSNSPQALAAAALEAADPHTSVTFIQLACSGALSIRGLLEPYEGQEPQGTEPLEPQLDEAARLSAGREVDAMLLSIGGNDVRFSAIVEACILQDGCFETPPVADAGAGDEIRDVCATLGPLAFLCDQYLADTPVPSESAEQIFFGDGTDCGGAPGDDPDRVGLDDLACNYEDVASRIAELDAAGGLDGILEDGGTARVYLTAYPSLSRGEPVVPGGETVLCGYDSSAPIEDRARNLPGITAEEMQWAEDVVVATLEDAMRTRAGAHGWRFVDTHVAEFDGHGYCAEDNWIVRIQQSVAVQGRLDPIESSWVGSVHPNLTGNDAYSRAIVDSLLCDLYAGCDPAGEPRASTETGTPTTSTTSTTVPDGSVCGDAGGDGTINASDALQVLRFAVGFGACKACLCDVDASGVIAASDALAVLRVAVGESIALVCPVCSA